VCGIRGKHHFDFINLYLTLHYQTTQFHGEFPERCCYLDYYRIRFISFRVPVTGAHTFLFCCWSMDGRHSLSLHRSYY